MISVIIPCFNAGSYLIDCLKSVQQQTIQDFEVLVINDGSSDNSQEVLKAFQMANPQFPLKVFEQKNKGVSRARNLGLSQAKGNFISFIDADDTVAPTFLETLLQGIDQAELSVVGIGGNGFARESAPFQGLIPKERFVEEFWLTQHLWGAVCNKLYSRQIIDDHQLTFDPELTIMEDMDFNLRYCQQIEQIAVDNQLLYTYRKHDQSTMHQGFTGQRLKVLDSFEKFLSLSLNQKDREIIQLHQVNSLFWLLRTLYKDGSSQDIRSYEEQIRQLLKEVDQGPFRRQGWKKGPFRYGTFWLYQLSPTLYRKVVEGAYRLKGGGAS